MSSLNNGVGNIKGTPAIITDTLANRPSASSLAVGTIFIDSATGNWYQVGTNNTWSNTGGGGGSATLQQVLANGNQSQGLGAIIALDPDVSNSYITLDGGTLTGPINLQVTNQDDENTCILYPNRVEVRGLYDTTVFAKLYGDSLQIYNQISETIQVSSNYDGNNNCAFIFSNDQTNVYIVKRPLTDSYDFGDKTYTLPFNNRGPLTLATQEICPAPVVDIDLSVYDFVPQLVNSGGGKYAGIYFNVLVGSSTNGVYLNSTFTDHVIYTFLNYVNNLTFKINTGGVIYGTSSSLPAGIVQVIKSGDDFFVTHP